jgi:hypothetical protein
VYTLYLEKNLGLFIVSSRGGVNKRRCHEIFDFSFFHESVLFAAQGAPPGVVETSSKWKESSIKKVLIFCLDTFG